MISFVRKMLKLFCIWKVRANKEDMKATQLKSTDLSRTWVSYVTKVLMAFRYLKKYLYLFFKMVDTFKGGAFKEMYF